MKLDAPRLCLTFDDGPQEGTESVLDVLKSTGVKGMFFLTGINSKTLKVSAKDVPHPSFDLTAAKRRYPGFAADLRQLERQRRLIRRMIDEGHTVANHGWDHDPQTMSGYQHATVADVQADFERNADYFARLVGPGLPGFCHARLPGDGRRKENLRFQRALVDKLGNIHVAWNAEFGRVFKHLSEHSWSKTPLQGYSSATPELPSGSRIGVALLHDRHWDIQRLTHLIGVLRGHGALVDPVPLIEELVVAKSSLVLSPNG